MSPQKYTAASFKPILKKLVQTPESFTPGDFKEAFHHLAAGPDVLYGSQIGAFFTAAYFHRLDWRPEMVAAGVEGILEHAHKVHIQEAEKDFIVNIIGTGGDGYNVFNVSTTAGVVAAGAGARVIKHGSRALTSLAGSADLMEALGCRFQAPRPGSTTSIPRIPFVFLHYTDFISSFAHLVPAVKSLPFPNIFHYIAPLADPARPQGMLLGVMDYKAGPIIANALHKMGIQRALVVCGQENLDEISCAGPSWTWELRDGKITESTVTPDDFGVEAHPIASVVGGSGKDNAETFK
ncbi:hypothetical protein H0H93_015282, partial [Arthromyces matolae]